jgi:TRAP-type C4-dicarboxylate transport system substrate-binding protein
MPHIKKIDTELTHYLSMLSINQKKSILEVAKTFVEKKDWWEELSLEQQKQIDSAIEEAQAGKLTANADVRKLYKKWLK